MGERSMDSKKFYKLDRASSIAETLKNIAFVFVAILILGMVIAGIVFLVEGATLVGVVLLLCGVIVGGFSLYCIYCFYVFLGSFIGMMYDIKHIRLGGDSDDVEKNVEKDAENDVKNPSEDETITVYLLRNINRNTYFSRIEKCENKVIAKLTSKISEANAFKSEEEVKQFAESKRLKLGTDWDIVEKHLTVCND